MRRPEGTLTDTGPLFALADSQGQPVENARCEALLTSLALPLVTVWPCLAEAMYLCGKEGGWFLQKNLRRLLRDSTLRVHMSNEAELDRSLELMEQYQDRPMDLADASLVALAEAQGYRRVFSIDSDSYVYRLADGSSLEVVPGPIPQRGSQ